MNHPFATLIIKAVLVCYSAWGTVVVADLVNCELRRPGQCEPQRAELRGAATAIPGTLLAWLADSPLTGKSASTKTYSTRKKTDEEPS